MSEQTGKWVRRNRTGPRHECEGPGPIQHPDIILGDLWRCPCGRLLQVRELKAGNTSGSWHMPVWKPARLWQRLRYWRQR